MKKEKKMNQVIKIKNFEGYTYHCSKCGAEIKHAFKVGNSNIIYGPECVLTIFRNAQKSIYLQIKRHKQLAKILQHKKVYHWEEYKIAHNFTDDQLENYFLEKGTLN